MNPALRNFFSKLSLSIWPAADLWRASKHGDLVAIRRLVESGADVNGKKDTLNMEGDSPLHFAARYNHVKSVQLLIELGAKVESRNNSGGTPLMDAASIGARVEMIDILAAAGANLNAQDKNGFTALTWAAFSGHENVVATLITKRANPNQEKGSKRSRVLTHAIEGKNRRVFEMLLAAGAKPGDAGDTDPALNTAAVFGHADFTDSLLKAGADPNAIDGSGMPALICAVRGKSLRVLQLILDAGADVNAQNTQDETALDIAREIKRKDMIQMLEKAGGILGADLPKQEEVPEAKSDWQLQDDSILEARIEPWPPISGEARLKVSIVCESELLGGWNVQYRIRAETDSDVPWKKMFPASTPDDEDEDQFEEDIQLKAGIWCVEFQVSGPMHHHPDLPSAWEITVGNK